MSYQGAFEPTKMCPDRPDARVVVEGARGHEQLSPATGSRRRGRASRSARRSCGTGPGDDWKRAIRSRPRMKRKSPASHMTPVENADPCSLAAARRSGNGT